MPKVRITRTYQIESAHFLPNVPEEHKCRRWHGHNFTIKIQIEGEVHQDTGFVLDYFEIDKRTKPVLKKWDHTVLNNHVQNPTSENLAIDLYREWVPLFSGMNLKVFVSENEHSYAEYPI